MVHKIDMLFYLKHLGQFKVGKLCLPTRDVATVKHIGSTYIFSGHKITNVMYIPEFRYNLLSVLKITKELKCVVMFYPDFCILQDLFGGQVKNIGKEGSGLYVLTSKSIIKAIDSTSTTSNSSLFPRSLTVNTNEYTRINVVL